MKNFFAENVDRERLTLILDVKMKYANNEISLEEGRQILREKLGSITPLEIAATEQELTDFERDQCQKEDIQTMTILFVDLLDTSRPDLPADHPILRYYEENDALRTILDSIDDLVQYPVIKNQWYELYDQLSQIRIHFSRKQNQLYSVLEKKGFTRPTTTMWTLDDFVRDEIRDLRALLETDEEEFIRQQQILVADVRDLMEKEEKILYPTSLSMISAEEFEEMKEGDAEIGFAWIKVDAQPAKASRRPSDLSSEEFMRELSGLLAKYNASADLQQLDVKTGKLSLEQINLIYQHMPVDISYVDEHEIVKFYTDTKHRVFPRSKNVIGRDVKNCHPRNSVHAVEEIIEKFRNGEQSEAEFWINKPGLFIYIKYVAVRDEEGRFRGVLEMMQDCTRIRTLEGSQTLLNWTREQSGNSAEESRKEPEKEPTTTPAETLTGKIDENTKLEALLKAYPGLKEELPKINPAFSRLNSPLARVLIPIATIRIMSEKASMPVEELIEKIQKYIDERQG